MKFKLTALFILFFVLHSCFSQKVDSVEIYAISMKSAYIVKINIDLIKTQAEAIHCINKDQTEKLHLEILDLIREKKLKKINNYTADIRLLFEFYRKGKISEIIGFTPYNWMFINNHSYSYGIENLKNLDDHLAGLSNLLQID
jgi:hypothetical protein